MKNLHIRYSVVATSVVTASLLVFMIAGAQNQPPTGKAPCLGCSLDGKTTPRMADGHPDFNGFWGGGNGGGGLQNLSGRESDGSVLFDFAGGTVDEQGRTRSSQPGVQPGFTIGSDKPEDNAPYKPEYFAKVKALADQTYGVANKNDPMFDCKPSGIPRGGFGQMHIVQTPGAMAVLFENGENDRIIYTDGRKHPDDLDTSYMGDSVGHWEGDTLVVDVAGLNDETWLAGSFGAPKYTMIHSDKEHVIERWTRNGDTLNYQATVEDPVMFTHPWVMKPKRIQHVKSDTDDYLMQYHCITEDKGHIIAPSDKDQFYCNYCVKPQDQK
jgi:hypothetical protein